MSLKQQFEFVHQRIRQACQRSGRDPSSVTLVCVTKGISPEAIQQAIALGVTDIGENRVQEALAKQSVLGGRLKENAECGMRNAECNPKTPHSPPHGMADPPILLADALRTPHSVRWHLIGHLQRNKARLAVELFDVVHSVDSLELIEELERARGSRLKALGKGEVKPLEVFVQVNVSGEATKFGCTLDEAPTLVRAIAPLPHLCLKGLMTLAPFTDNPEHVRSYFRQLRMLRDSIQCLFPHPSPITHHPSLLLSMGMSQDFEVAIEEGADFVRVGTAIFGA